MTKDAVYQALETMLNCLTNEDAKAVLRMGMKKYADQKAEEEDQEKKDMQILSEQRNMWMSSLRKRKIS